MASTVSAEGLSGAGLIWLSLTLSGLYTATRLKKRTEFLGEILNFLKALAVEIEFSLSDLPSILKKVSASDMCSKLLFLKQCVMLIKDNVDLPVAWSASIEEKTPLLNKEEKDKLNTLGLSLGTTDLTGQKKIIELFSEYFTSFYVQAKNKEDKLYGIYILIGTLSGFGLFIMII